MPRRSAEASLLLDLQSIEDLVGLSGPALLRSLLQQQVSMTGAEAGAIIEKQADGTVGVLTYWPGLSPGGATPAWLAACVEQIASEPRSIAVALAPSGKQDLTAGTDYVAAQPLKVEGGRHLMAALHLHDPDAEGLGQARERLAWSALAFVAAEQRQHATTEASGRQRLTVAMDVLVATQEDDRFGAMVLAFCNQLSVALGAQHVAVGLLQRGEVKLAGISHSDEAGRKTSLAQSLERVMEEAADQGVAVIYPPDENAISICRSAEEFTQVQGPRSLCTVPVEVDDDAGIVICVERSANDRFNAADQDLINLAGELCAVRLVEAAHRDRWFGARLAVSLRRWAAGLFGAEYTWAKLAAALLITSFVYICVAEGPDYVESSFVIHPEVKRVVAAPFEGTIASSAVREGDRVKQGQTILAELDDSELRLERVGALAEQSALLKQSEQNRADGKPTEARLASLRAESLANRVALLDRRIARAKVVAPVNGEIISGDLTRQVGAPVQQGQALFEIAPTGPVIAELRVADSDVWRVEPGQQGQLATVSHPDRKLPFTVERIFPMAEVMDGRNVFRVEVRLDGIAHENAARWLRPGVEGQARVDTGEAPYIELWTRDIVNWFRMKLWL